MKRELTFGDLIYQCREALRPPERLTVSEAAERYRHLHNPGSYVGPWKNETTPYLVEVMNTLNSRDFNATVLAAPAQCGKHLSLDTPLITPTGWTTMGDLCVGDRVYGPDGKPTNVTYISPVITNNPQYVVSFSDGSEIKAGGDHLWGIYKGMRYYVMSTDEILAESKGHNLDRYWLPRITDKKFLKGRNVDPIPDIRTFKGIMPLVQKVPMLCISVDNDSHLYLAGESLIPTHNTDAILNWQLYTVVCDPADMILYQTSQSVARDFSRRRVDRLHRHSTEVGKRVNRRKDADNTFDKHYTSGMMFTLSWPTINELSGRPVGRVALTDYDRMSLDIDGEGSPFSLARKRTTTFGSFAMTFVESSPGYSVTVPNWIPQSKHESPPAPGILSLYNQGDRRRWYWPCPNCGDYYEPSFNLLKWVDSKDLAEASESAQMMCPSCGSLTDPTHKYDMNLAGVWAADGQSVSKSGKLVGEATRSDIASFWLKGPAASFASWKTLVMNYLKAEQEFDRTGTQDALRSTVNTDQGEPYFERGFGSSRSPEDLKSRSEDIYEEPAVPDGVRFLIATIDVQGNRWEVQVHGIVPPPAEGALFDIFVIDRFAIIKSKRTDDDGEHYWVKPGTYLEDWDLITEQVLRKTYPLADGSGRRLGIKQVGCDSGGKKGVTSMAYAYWRNLRADGLASRFMLLKGVGEPSAPRVNLVYPDSSGGRKDKRALAKGEIPVLLLQTNKIKDQLDHMLDRDTAGGMVRFSDILPDEFYTELTVEQKDLKGNWINPRKYRNEAWDLLVYCLALCSHMRIEYLNWDDPPGWAADWDQNLLIVQSEDSQVRFEAKKDSEYNDLKSLAELLA